MIVSLYFILFCIDPTPLIWMGQFWLRLRITASVVIVIISILPSFWFAHYYLLVVLYTLRNSYHNEIGHHTVQNKVYLNSFIELSEVLVFILLSKSPFFSGRYGLKRKTIRIYTKANTTMLSKVFKENDLFWSIILSLKNHKKKKSNI